MNPSLEKRGMGRFMENRFIQKIPLNPLCQRGKMQGRIPDKLE